MPINIGGDGVSEVTIGGEVVEEITVDGDVVYTDASAATIVESWEDDDFAEWDNVSADWTTQTDFTPGGAIGARYSSSSSSGMVRTTGVDRLPQQGDIFKYDWRTSVASVDAANIEFRVMWADTGTDWYEIHHDLSNNELEFWLRGSTNDQLFDVASDLPANTHLRTVVKWDDGTLGGSAGDFTISVLNVEAGTVLASGTANDPTLTGPGQIQLAPQPEEQWTLDFDYWRITTP